MSKRNNLNDLIEKSNVIHKNKYSYEHFVYKSMHEKSYITCPVHGDFLKSMHDHIIGKQGCPLCAKINRKQQNLRYNDEEFKEKLYNLYGNKYNLDNIRYINRETLIEMECPLHGKFRQSAKRLLKGFSCVKCDDIKRRNNNGYNSIGIIKKFVDKHGDLYDYTKFNYVNYHTDGIIICPKHGEFKLTPSEHIRGTGCPICNAKKYVSNEELELQNFIEDEYNGEIIKNARNIIYPNELDIYNPDKNIAIEFNGLYWHSNAIKLDSNYHLNKTIKCQQKNINLIHIFEDEWINKKEIVKSKIREFVGLYPNKINAEECIVINGSIKVIN